MAPAQATRGPRDRYTARPHGVVGKSRTLVSVERSGNVPAPRSRRPASTSAPVAPTMTSAAIGTNANGRGDVSGWDSSIQPSGVHQRSHESPAPESATIRIA